MLFSHSERSVTFHYLPCFRMHIMAVLLLAFLVLNETLGAHHKSSKESKKQKKTEGEPHEAKKRYSGTDVKQHKR